MKSRTIRLLLRKELLDVFRDRKAIIMLFLVPLLIYPLIFFGAFAIMTMVQSSMEEGEYVVLVETEDDGALAEEIDNYIKEKSSDKNSEKIRTISYDEAVKLLTEKPDGSHSDIVDQLMQSEVIDVYVSSEKDASGRMTYHTRYVSSITNSNYGETVVKEILDKLSDRETEELLTEAGLDAKSITHPFDIKRDNIASTEQSAGSLLGTILPFMLVVSLLMGTMYPAIDVTAGEKERGTLETLLTLPVKNYEIILAKFLTVAMMGIISALLNILSMGIMVLYLAKLVSTQLDGFGLDLSGFRFSTFVPAMLVTVLAVLAFSLFISAVTMCITAFAKSYKEANNYITPLTLAVMLTGYIGFIPNIKLTSTVALIPVANICLLIKELLLFKAEMDMVVIVLLSNVFYAMLAIAFLSRIYDSESVLFDEGRAGVQLFQRRSNMTKGGVPTTGDVWFITLFVMLIYIYIGSMLQLKYDMAGVFYSQLLIIGIPLLFAIYTKRSLRKTFSLRPCRPLQFLAAIFLYIGTFLLEGIVSSCISSLFPEKFNETSSALESNLLMDSTLLMFLIIAVTPAICEEMMFRGFIQSGLGSKYKPATTIFLTSLIFGIFHTSMIRLIPTAMLGGCFALLVYYTGSILPGMFFHFFNNSLSVITIKYPGFLEKMLPIIEADNPTLPGSLVAVVIGLLMVYAGMTILIKEKSKEDETGKNKN